MSHTPDRISQKTYEQHPEQYPVERLTGSLPNIDDQVAYRVHYIDEDGAQTSDVVGSHFFYDGCHKIYVMSDNTTAEWMVADGYTIDELHPISSLIGATFTSCPLVFISGIQSNGDPIENEHFTNILPQCSERILFERVQ